VKATTFLGLSTLVVIAGFGGSMLVYATQAHSHDAMPTNAQPLGWWYGWECCSGMDCAQAASEAVTTGPRGYLITLTGEIIGYADKRIKRSRDEYYHRCTHGGDLNDPKSICLYVPDRGL
jgi:hypothetical protein